MVTIFRRPIDQHRLYDDLVFVLSTKIMFSRQSPSSSRSTQLSRELRVFLTELALEQYYEKAWVWCQEQGASFLEEIFNERALLADDLMLKPLERKRLLHHEFAAFAVQRARMGDHVEGSGGAGGPSPTPGAPLMSGNMMFGGGGSSPPARASRSPVRSGTLTGGNDSHFPSPTLTSGGTRIRPVDRRGSSPGPPAVPKGAGPSRAAVHFVSSQVTQDYHEVGGEDEDDGASQSSGDVNMLAGRSISAGTPEVDDAPGHTGASPMDIGQERGRTGKGRGRGEELLVQNESFNEDLMRPTGMLIQQNSSAASDGRVDSEAVAKANAWLYEDENQRGPDGTLIPDRGHVGAPVLPRTWTGNASYSTKARHKTGWSRPRPRDRRSNWTSAGTGEQNFFQDPMGEQAVIYEQEQLLCAWCEENPVLAPGGYCEECWGGVDSTTPPAGAHPSDNTVLKSPDMATATSAAKPPAPAKNLLLSPLEQKDVKSFLAHLQPQELQNYVLGKLAALQPELAAALSRRLLAKCQVDGVLEDGDKMATLIQTLESDPNAILDALLREEEGERASGGARGQSQWQ